MTATATPAQIDQHLEELRAGAARWAVLPIPEKIALFSRLRDGVSKEAERWVDAASRAKGIAGSPLAGEEWISGPWAVLYALNRYMQTLEQIEHTGRPQIDPRRVRRRDDGQVVVDAFPVTLYDRVLLSGIRAEVWMQPGVTPANLAATLGPWYQESSPQPRVALVLGAGNIASIAPLDVLYKLVSDGCVCMLKMNPVNDYLGPILEDAFAPLVEGGYLRFAYGGADVGKYLCAHEGVDEIHITGSATTHDAIVFGDGADAADRKRRNDPVLTKPIFSELGNVSPTIVVPGPWNDADFRFQAEHIVTQKLHNGGFNCIASQVLILPESWDGTPRLIAEIQALLERLADRQSYYPGAARRRESLIAGHDDVFNYGGNPEANVIARTLVRVDAQRIDDPAFATEAFASVLAYTSIPGDTQSYLDAAVAFANEVLWGTLGGNIIVHPTTMRDHANAVDRAIAEMRYGCVGVNAWTGVGYFICETPWGAFPGHTLDDVRSGIGVVHNSHLFSRSQKAVVYAPFAPFPRSFFGYGASLLPKPPWFVTNRTAAEVGRALCEFETHKTPLRAAKIAALAMGG